MTEYDVIVVGAGPAGMMSAGRAAECGAKVLILEQNNQLGQKLNTTGGGRCNITNAEFELRDFAAHYGDAAKFLYSAFSRFGVQDCFSFFEDRGLPLKVEDRKRAFPEGDRARDVTEVLRQYMKQHGVCVKTNARVSQLILSQQGNRIEAVEVLLAGQKQSFRCCNIILATGGPGGSGGPAAKLRAKLGKAQKTPSAGLDGFSWLAQLGHTVHKAEPDVVPLKVQEPWVKELSGTVLEDFSILFVSRKKESFVLEPKAGERLLFTHFGLSGPAILNQSHRVKNLLQGGPVFAYLKLFRDSKTLRDFEKHLLGHFGEHSNKNLRNGLKLLLATPSLARALEHLFTEELLQKRLHSITREERQKVAETLYAMPFTVTATMGYDKAVICDGGVHLKEIDTRSMRSQKYENLFVIGDLLHINRPSGGFSLQLCWTTGQLAGENAALL